MSKNDSEPQNPNLNINPTDAGEALDLPPEMFRSGDTVEETSMMMQRINFGLQEVQAKWTEVSGLALFEGDIVLASADVVRNAPDSMGIGISGEEYRWPNGILPYVTDEMLRPRVEAATNHWQQRTPFRFVERTNEADYISFERQNGCWSQVGRQGGMQVISLGTGCGVGAAIHEIGHAIGLWHEQSRSDRDQFIEVILANVAPNRRHNFDMHIQDGDDLGQYDFDSIMHYPATAFSINGQPTIRARNGQIFGQRNGLSAGDIAAVRLMYPGLAWT
jgi:hypothetical protein